ncbi:MAG: GGDEF domain-containing protein [Planctomycetota bacterium]
MSERTVDRSHHRLLVIFLCALLWAVLAALGLVPFVGRQLTGRWSPDLHLLGSLAVTVVLCVAIRVAMRRRTIDPAGRAMAGALALLGLCWVVAIHRTGGLFSPLFLVLATVVGFAAMVLRPFAHLCTLTTTAAVYALAALGVLDLWIPPGAGSWPSAATFTPRELAPVLIVQLGVLGILAGAVHLLAQRVRHQHEELVGLTIRDGVTGVLQRAFFHARLVSLLERQSGHPAGVGLIVFELGAAPSDIRLLARVGGTLVDRVRGNDIVGRIGDAKFGVVAAGTSEQNTRALADRLAARLAALKVAVSVGVAHGKGEAGVDPMEAAHRLVNAAEAELNFARADDPRRPVSAASAP